MILDPIDQRIRDQGFNFVPFDRYLASPFQIPNTENTENARVSAGLPVIYQSQGGGGGGAYTGGINDLITDYNTITKERYFRNQPTPLVDDLYQSKLDKTFMGFPSYREQQLTGPDLGEYIGTDTDVPLELTTAGKIQQNIGKVKEGIGNFADKIGGFGPISMALNAMDRFKTLSPADQQFIQMNMGYTGPTVFGENTSGLSKDPYGINTRSAFGNYADYVSDYKTDYTPEELAQMSKFRQQKIAYYQQKQKELKEIKERKEAEARAEAQAIQDRNRAERTGGYQSSFAQDRDFMEGRSGAGTGLGASDKGGSDTMGSFMDGGIVDLVDIYD
jgi:hypothetical protein